MNVIDQAQEYINGLGIEQAAEHFKVKPATVNNWMKTKRFPQEVFQMMWDAPPRPEPESPPPTTGLEEEITSTLTATEEAGLYPQQELSIADIMQHLQDHYEAITDLYALVAQLQQGAIQGQQVPGHMPTTQRVNVQRNAFGQLPGIVMQESGIDSMVRPSQAIMPRVLQAPVIRNAPPPVPVPSGPRNPDPNHWTKPKQITRSERR